MEQNTQLESETPESAAPLYKKGAELGLVAGIIGIALSVMLYLMGMKFMATWWVGILIGVFFIVLHVILALRIKKKAQIQEINYWQAFIAVIIMLCISGFIATGYQLLLTKVIDPDFNENMKVAVVENTSEMMANFGAPQEQIDETIDGIVKSFDEQKESSVSRMLLGFVFWILLYAVFALILAIFVRKKKPVFDPNITRE